MGIQYSGRMYLTNMGLLDQGDQSRLSGNIERHIEGFGAVSGRGGLIL